MHKAPSVIYPVGRGVLLKRLICSLALCALCAQFAWFWQMSNGVPGADWRMLLGAGALLLAGAYTARAWRRWPRGELRWLDGAWSWHVPGAEVDLEASAQAGPLQVCCDFQSALLLRWQPNRLQPTVRWIWAEQGACPSRWMDLRRAVYAARPDSDDGEVLDE